MLAGNRAAISKRIEGHLPNTQHFAEDEAWNRPDEPCMSVVYEWRCECKFQ
jgi:hypothetical protein